MSHGRCEAPRRRARDSRTTVRRRVIVAFPSRRTVAAKECAASPKALGTGMCRVFTEGRGTTDDSRPNVTRPGDERFVFDIYLVIFRAGARRRLLL